ncbi:hypothetical protein RJ639_018524 [Escallonia herrerae]|uniref:PPM-type phosphatase domain-containing protein n=1 Tax=Escallonia herrerae TaxID=1293975 RepID=A0AA89AIF2_9ASTE|nr:hypothetical protein RJ639_018524 [Escallonia herrerae]
MVAGEDQAVGRDGGGGVSVVAEEGGPEVEALVVVVKVGQFDGGVRGCRKGRRPAVGEAAEFISEMKLPLFHKDINYLQARSSKISSHLSPALDEETVHKILKEPVQKAIQEIEIEFTTEALKNNYIARKLKAEELSRDHHPDRANERARIEAAGCFVRVQASTALSRSCELLAM